MRSQTQHPICPFRTIILAGLTALLMPSVVLPMSAQDSVPPSAEQAASMPKFASRLHPSRPTPPRPKPAMARRLSRSGAAPDGFIYDNGPINGNVYAWTINFGFVVSDSFTIGEPTNVTEMTFGAWLSPGDVLETAEISITAEPDGGTTYFDQNVRFNGSSCFINQTGFNVCTETSEDFQSPTLQPGTYWVNLQNSVVNTGDPVYWDQNNGPSQAYEGSVGTIPSESFALGNGDQPQPCFGSQGNLQIIYDFTQQQQDGHSQSGVTIDRAGNLYGTSPDSGSNGAGFAFKLARFAGWVLEPLFNFSGGSDGDQPSGVIVGPNGSLYGGAQGGLQNCGTDGSQYCGLVFNLRPHQTACSSSQCGWDENVPYRFDSEGDGSGTVNVSASDQQGNLYGTTTSGGASDAGTVFELTPSAGGNWTKTVLYNFSGQVDGYGPTQVLAGNDGNLYGVAFGGINNHGVVFQLTPSGGQRTETVLHAFSDAQPAYLVQDSAGNLYGISNADFEGRIFTLQKNGPGWTFEDFLVQHEQFDHLNNLAIDAAGNLYGTGSGGVQKQYYVTYIFKASYDARHGWHYEDLDYLGRQDFFPGGGLALDTSGNLYGTTADCGAYGQGTVWQLSP